MNIVGNAPDRGLSWNFSRWRFASKNHGGVDTCHVSLSMARGRACGKGIHNMTCIKGYAVRPRIAAVLHHAVFVNCRGTIILCWLPRSYQSLWNAVQRYMPLLITAVIYFSVNCYGTTAVVVVQLSINWPSDTSHHLQHRKRLVKYKTFKHVLRVIIINQV